MCYGTFQDLERFTLGRKDLGELTFINPVNVLGVNFDAAIEVEKGRILWQPPASSGTPNGLNGAGLLTYR